MTKTRINRTVLQSCCLGLIALGLGACSLDRMVVERFKNRELEFLRSDLATSQTVPLSLVGRPFDVSDDMLTPQVIAAVDGRVQGAEVNFSAVPWQQKTKHSHVVLAFDLAKNVAPWSLCQMDQAPQMVAPESGLKMTMVYCFDNTLFTSVTATMQARPTGANIADFSKTLSSMMVHLFDPLDDLRGGGCSTTPC